MNKTNLRFEIWVDGRDNRVSIRSDRPDNAEGLRYIWFLLNEEELGRFESYTFSDTLEDGAHRLHLCGDILTFYDFNIPREDAGEMRVPFIKVELPVEVRRLVARIVRRTWKGLRANYDAAGYNSPRVELHFTPEQIDRLLKKYGQGKGACDIIIDECIQERFEEHMLNPEFAKNVQRLDAIARNTTVAKHQRARVKIFRDSESYYWIAETWKGRRIMNGGLIDHGRGGPPSWSIHT